MKSRGKISWLETTTGMSLPFLVGCLLTDVCVQSAERSPEGLQLRSENVDVTERVQSLVLLRVESTAERVSGLHYETKEHRHGTRVNVCPSRFTVWNSEVCSSIAIHCDYKQVKKIENYIVQEYIREPYLLDGSKFGRHPSR